jgi:CheY-like chemotaxis protein
MRKILLVEDHPDTARLYRELLTFEGYDVRVALDGEQALESLQEERPDMILLDIMLPGKDGFEVARTIAAGGNGIPIVIVTALNPQDVRSEPLTGIKRVVFKPCRPKTLLEAVQDVVEAL